MMIISKYKILFLIFFSVFFICCSPIIFKPTSEDVDLAKQKWENVSIDQLNNGFKLFKAKCSGCHFLPIPRDYSEAKWIHILPEMSEKSKLTHEEYDLVFKYVITKSYSQIKKQ